MAATRQISLSWMLHIPVDPNSRPIGELIAECEQIESYAYVYHEPFKMRPHYHLYLKLKDPLSAKEIRERFNPLLAYPGVSQSLEIEYMLRTSDPGDVVANFSIKNTSRIEVRSDV